MEAAHGVQVASERVGVHQVCQHRFEALCGILVLLGGGLRCLVTVTVSSSILRAGAGGVPLPRGVDRLGRLRVGQGVATM